MSSCSHTPTKCSRNASCCNIPFSLLADVSTSTGSELSERRVDALRSLGQRGAAPRLSGHMWNSELSRPQGQSRGSALTLWKPCQVLTCHHPAGSHRAFPRSDRKEVSIPPAAPPWPLWGSCLSPQCHHHPTVLSGQWLPNASITVT